jgi:predicted ester cyclase
MSSGVGSTLTCRLTSAPSSEWRTAASSAASCTAHRLRIVAITIEFRFQGKKPEFGTIAESVILCSGHRPNSMILTKQIMRTNPMSKEEDNKAVVGRWFTEFWGKNVNLAVVDAIAAPDMLLKYSLHDPRRGRDDIKAFMTDFRSAFPDLNFWGTADLIAEGDYVVGQWEGGGTHTGPAFDDFLIGGLPAATGRRMHFTGTTVLKVINGKIVEEIGLDDGVTALTQLGLIKAA